MQTNIDFVTPDNNYEGWQAAQANFDELYDGLVVLELTAGETLANGDLCYLKSDGEMYKVDADAVATTKGLLGICTESLTNGVAGAFVIRGKYTTTGLTAASEYFVSTTAGDWTATAPSGTGDTVRLVGYALSTTVLFFDPAKTYLVI